MYDPDIHFEDAVTVAERLPPRTNADVFPFPVQRSQRSRRRAVVLRHTRQYSV